MAIVFNRLAGCSVASPVVECVMVPEVMGIEAMTHPGAAADFGALTAQRACNNK
jgi:hypothetical protein